MARILKPFSQYYTFCLTSHLWQVQENVNINIKCQTQVDYTGYFEDQLYVRLYRNQVMIICVGAYPLLLLPIPSYQMGTLGSTGM